MSAAQGYDLSNTVAGPKFAITQFSYEEFLSFWPVMKKELDTIRPMWRHWTEDHILTAMATQELTLWGCGSPPNAEFVFFVEVHVYPAMRVLTIPLAFGKFNPETMPLMDATMEQYARVQGCDEIEIRGRSGWGPEFKKLGFTETSRVWTRPVTNLRNN